LSPQELNEAMAERLNKLQDTLAELETELNQVDSLDDATRAHLSQVASEILARLAQKQAAASGTIAAHAPAPSADKVDATTLREQAKTFESEHPQLSAIIFRVVDLLGQVGI
jgi:hypothetical protein